MPNGQNRVTYTEKCHKFIELNYPALKRYALHQTKYNYDKADDLLNSAIAELLEGRWKIDFDKYPLSYFQYYLQCGNNPNRYKKNQLDNNLIFVDPAELSEEDSLVDERTEEQTDMEYLLEQMPQLMSCLTTREAWIISSVFDGKTNKSIAASIGVSVTTLDRYLATIKKKIHQKALALLQA